MNTGFTLVKTGLLGGMAAWMTLAVANNILDPGTNVHLLGRMLGMDGIRADEVMGNGLEGRALPAGLAGWLLGLVIAVQLVVAGLMWRGAWLMGRAVRDGGAAAEVRGIRAANLGLGAFMGLWFWFMIGGLWFGYWMKLGAVQNVHMTLLTLAVLSLLLVNLRPRPLAA